MTVPVHAEQVYSAAAGWKKVAGCAVAPMLTADTTGSKRDSHGWLFAWKGATVFQVGFSTPVAEAPTLECRD